MDKGELIPHERRARKSAFHAYKESAMPMVVITPIAEKTTWMKSTSGNDAEVQKKTREE